MSSAPVPPLAPPPVRLPGPLLSTALAWWAAYAAWSLTVPPFDAAWQLRLDDLAVVPLRLAAMGAALVAARRAPRDSAVRAGLLLLGISLGLGVAANLLRTLAPGGQPLPGEVALAFALPQGALMLGGLWRLARLPSPDSAERDTAADWLDAAAIVLALFLVAAHFVAGGNPFDSLHFGARRWVFLLYLIGDILAVFLVATAWFRRPAGVSRDALGLLTLGFTTAAIVDLVYDRQLQLGLWTNGGPLDLAIATAFLLLFAGFDLQRRLGAGEGQAARARTTSRHIVAPLAILTATVPMLLLAWTPGTHGSHLAFHVTGVVALLGIVLVRQHRAREQVLQLARARAAADARFRSLVQRSSDAILQVGTDQVIQWASPSAGELAGSLPALLVGRRVTELAHPADRDKLGTFLANAGQPFARNAAIRWRLGRPEHWHEVESVVNDLTADADVRAIVLNTRDVSERVRLERQLRQSQKLEAVGRLAGGIAHDFNNVLAAIGSHAQLVRQALPAGDAHVDDLLEIERTAQRGAALTRRLLSFSRPEAGELAARALPELVRGMEPMLRRLLVGQVDLALDLEDAPLWVRAAEGQLEQVLMNLAINARDAMPDGGTVRVRVRALTVRPGAAAEGELPGRWAELTVSDDGVGMDEATLARLFEPFFTTKPSGQGTGLGLTTVRGIVRALGGQVLATSAPGAGTSMRVLLPLATAEEPAAAATVAAPATPAAAAPSRATVLLVDDEVALRRAMERLLERNGYTVIGAGAPHEALDLLETLDWRVDLVITDMVMPRMGGREFVARLRARRPDLPVLCMSGHMEWGEDASDEPDAPWSPDRLLAKPFAFPEFLQRVRDALAGEAARPAAG